MSFTQAFWFLLWRIRDGDNTLRIRYPLTKKQVVWDVGGYVGEWSETINNAYSPQIVLFEPVEKYYKILQERFRGCPNVQIKKYGLSSKNEKTYFSPAGIGSSRYKKGTEPVMLKDVAVEMSGKVDLLKLNIEGAEYDVLERLIFTGKIRKVKYLQVQFHNFVPHAHERYAKIVKELKKTHKRTYSYPWIWEGWVLR